MNQPTFIESDLRHLLDQFVHKIRNPVHSMNINIKVLEKLLDRNRGRDDTNIRRHLDIVATDLSLLKQSIVTFSELLVPLEQTKSWVSVANLARKSLHLLPSHLRREVQIEMDSDSPSLFINKRQVEKALLELLLNAIEASLAGDMVTVQARIKGQLVSIDIRDRGSGIQKTDRENIFQPFFTTKEGRVGLGLTRAMRFASGNGGKVILKQSSKKGSVFSIIFQVRN